MNPGLVVKLRPSGPWRIGPDSGARNRVDVIYHSDSLYSAITSAMARLSWLEEWLDATARTGSPAVSFSSCFPYLNEVAFIVPPRTIWPPASPSAQAARVRWKSARFIPLRVVQSILAGRSLDENQWSVDGASDCLVPAGSPGPFRIAVRWNAGVDRLTGASERHSTACLEFRAGSGLWTVVSFQDEAAQTRWSGPVKAAFRLLADTGFGGERSRGWGRSEAPDFTDGMLPDLILPLPSEDAVVVEAAVIETSPTEAEPDSEEPAPETPALAASTTSAHWLLSLFTPAAADAVDWRRGNYTVLARGGRVDSPAGSGELKKQIQMVAEGSVLYAETTPRGSAADVSPDGFPHPVFRAGFALAIPLPEVR